MIATALTTVPAPYIAPGLKHQINHIPPIRRAIIAIGREHGLTEQQVNDCLWNKSRKREIVIIRQTVQAMVKFLYPKISLKSIGLQYGNKNHATILNSCRVIRNIYQTDRGFTRRIDRILLNAEIMRIQHYFSDPIVSFVK